MEVVQCALVPFFCCPLHYFAELLVHSECSWFFTQWYAHFRKVQFLHRHLLRVEGPCKGFLASATVGLTFVDLPGNARHNARVLTLSVRRGSQSFESTFQ